MVFRFKAWNPPTVRKAAWFSGRIHEGPLHFGNGNRGVFMRYGLFHNPRYGTFFDDP